MTHTGLRALALSIALTSVTTRAHAQQPPAAPVNQPAEITIGVVVLNELPRGKEVSGRVVENPEKYQDIPGLRVVTAKVPKQSAGGSTATLEGVVVDVGDGRKQPANKALRWIPTAMQTAMMITVLLRDQPSRPIAQETIPVVNEPSNGSPGGSPSSTGGGNAKPETPKPEPTKPGAPKPETTKPTPTKPETPTPSAPTERSSPSGAPDAGAAPQPEVSMPVTATQGGVHVVHGNPSGNSEAMNVTVDGAPALIVAAKPGVFFFEIPESIPPGEHIVQLILGPGMPSITMRLYVIGFNMMVDRTNLLRGQSTRFRVAISGLDKLPPSFWEEMGVPPAELVDLKRQEEHIPGFHRPAAADKGTLVLVLVNRSQQTIKMGKGNVVVLHLHKNDFEHGTYTYEDKIQSIMSGDFSVTGTLTPFLKETHAPVVSR